MMATSRTVYAIVPLLGLAAVMAACDKPAPDKPVETAAVAPPAPKPVSSINELLVMIVDRPGELLWDVEKAGHAPRSAEAWYQLENHAVEVASAGTLIQLGGTGPNDMGWAAEPKWQASATAMITAAQHARLAAHAKDLPDLVKANGEIVDACEACHKVFKPNIPTAGLFMHRPPVSAPS
jgi:cytochrome c556